MKILFVHQNMPAQFRHLAAHFASDPGNSVVYVTKRGDFDMPGVRRVTYDLGRKPNESIHPYLRSVEEQLLYGQAVARKLLELRQGGFRPDLAVGHPGWGEMLFFKDIFPSVPTIHYCEFFYRARGSDFDFGSTGDLNLDGVCRLRIKNTTLLHGLEACERGISPTRWQWQQHPREFLDKISVIHDGIDTEVCRPDESARFELPTGRALTRQDEVVTYVSRNLEPYRGFPTFMRALERLCRRRPNMQAVVVGGDGVSYGARLPEGETYRERLLKEVRIDPARVHFLGRIPYDKYLKVLQVSSAHVYLTYPFVLSWSMLEAMAAGCLVVGSRTPPVEEVIEDGGNGLLADFFSAEEVADRVEAALDGGDRSHALRAAARRTIVERYDLRTVCLPAQLRIIHEVSGAPRSAMERAPAAAGAGGR